MYVHVDAALNTECYMLLCVRSGCSLGSTVYSKAYRVGVAYRPHEHVCCSVCGVGVAYESHACCSVCGVGVAYGARISGIRMIDGPMTDATEATAFTKSMDVNDIYSCRSV